MGQFEVSLRRGRSLLNKEKLKAGSKQLLSEKLCSVLNLFNIPCALRCVPFHGWLATMCA
jgi:hypothetical protein